MNTNRVLVRKSVYSLSVEEISNLRNAFNLLYSTPASKERGSSKIYQEKAGILIKDGHYLRNDLLFLPWARAYFSDFEKALQNALSNTDATITLPYWDYTSPRAIKEGIPPLFADQYYETIEMDENGVDQSVKVANPLYMAEYKTPLRTFRSDDQNQALLIKAKDLLETTMKSKDFVSFSTNLYPVDIISHTYIGGSSANTSCTAYDPIFWFTHCQLDHFWYQWQQENGNTGMPESVLSAALNPFTKGKLGMAVLRTEDVLDTKNLGYTYLR